MIYICDFNSQRLIHERWDAKYAIVRSYKHPKAGITQLAVLSPSTDLFFKYQDLKNKGCWNENTFQTEYVPVFLNEMQSAEAKAALNQLFVESKTKKIALICYCHDENLCHRSIIAGLLNGAGALVVTQTGESYTKYFDEYKMIKERLSVQ